MEAGIVDISRTLSSLKYLETSTTISFAESSLELVHTTSSQVANANSSRYRQNGSWTKRCCWYRTYVTKYILGTIKIDLLARKDAGTLEELRELKIPEEETHYTLHPALWLVRLGIRYGVRLKIMSSSTQDWNFNLSPYPTVPDDSLIFKFSNEGNVAAIRKLLSDGQASIRDTDSTGCTPLHVSLSVIEGQFG